jgi:hypothetical protein
MGPPGDSIRLGVKAKRLKMDSNTNFCDMIYYISLSTGFMNTLLVAGVTGSRNFGLMWIPISEPSLLIRLLFNVEFSAARDPTLFNKVRRQHFVPLTGLLTDGLKN